MKLPKSTWCRPQEDDSGLRNYCQFFPEDGVVLNITPNEESGPPFLVWGCHYVERGDGRVWTSLGSRHGWNEESYSIRGSRLIWVTSSGKQVMFDPIEESELPVEIVILRQQCFTRLIAEEVLPPD